MKPQIATLKTLFGIQNEIENLANNIKIATRKRILGDFDENKKEEKLKEYITT
jgi:hypothetical protein